jgi:hypothetical protein
MYAHRQWITPATVVLLLLGGCQSTATPPATLPAPTATLPYPTPTPVPPADTPLPFRATPEPPTSTPVPPTVTPVLPTSTPQPTPADGEGLRITILYDNYLHDERLTSEWRKRQANRPALPR